MVYSYVKTNNPEKLIKEINASSISSLILKITIQGTYVDVETTSDLDQGQQSSLLAVVQNHNPDIPDVELIVKKKIYQCMDFGRDIIAEFGAQNVATGMSDAQMTQLAEEFSSIQNLLLSGSLRLAKLQTEANTSVLVSSERKAYFANKIGTFLAGL